MAQKVLLSIFHTLLFALRYNQLTPNPSPDFCVLAAFGTAVYTHWFLFGGADADSARCILSVAVVAIACLLLHSVTRLISTTVRGFSLSYNTRLPSVDTTTLQLSSTNTPANTSTSCKAPSRFTRSTRPLVFV